MNSVFSNRLHEMVQKACSEAGMLPGDGIFTLPEVIREIVTKSAGRMELLKSMQTQLADATWGNRGKY